jgi:serine/threonine protein phosphatase PrpC
MVRLDHGEQAVPDRQQAVWAGGDDTQHVRNLGVWTEKRAGLGEDAEPTLLHRWSTAEGLIGVYDGMGGSGARLLGRSTDDRPISSAFVASRLAHLTVQEWFVAGRRHGQPLDERLREVFDGARPPGALKLRGTITKQLPTTMALIEYAPGPQPGSTRVTARWAGDSRCYLLTPGAGLRQLSRDDSVVDDPLETLMADQPLTNHLAAGLPFRVHDQVLPSIDVPCLLLCATDGFFGYVASPAIFEYQLLSKLERATGLEQWGELLADWRRATSADDATLALVALGFSDFEHLKASFRNRLDHLYHEHWTPLQQLENAVLDEDERRHAVREYRRSSWAGYQAAYLELTPERGET